METKPDGPWDLLAWSLLGAHLPGQWSKTDDILPHYLSPVQSPILQDPLHICICLLNKK